jgi:hypothetical protein
MWECAYHRDTCSRFLIAEDSTLIKHFKIYGWALNNRTACTITEKLDVCGASER